MNSYENYQTLIKPGWAPPSWVFGPVWSLLYLIIALSFGYVLLMYLRKQISFAVLAPFLLNLLFNFLFTPLQFGLKNLLLATVDIFLVLATALWLITAIHPHARWVAYANLPYLAWVSFATVLQTSITWLNLKKS